MESSEGATQKPCVGHAGLAWIAMLTQGFGRFASSTLGFTLSRLRRWRIYFFCQRSCFSMTEFGPLPSSQSRAAWSPFR